MADRPPPEGRIQPTPAKLVAGWGVVGLVGGWLFRPLSLLFASTAPVVTWLPALVLFFVAALLGGTAWFTWRTVRADRLLEPHHAVNRLVLGKACALVGALVAGGYFGYAVSWVGLKSELADERILHSGLAGFGGLLMCGAAILLENACRVRSRDKDA